MVMGPFHFHCDAWFVDDAAIETASSNDAAKRGSHDTDTHDSPLHSQLQAHLALVIHFPALVQVA
jgi:hypothetical protein